MSSSKILASYYEQLDYNPETDKIREITDFVIREIVHHAGKSLFIEIKIKDVDA